MLHSDYIENFLEELQQKAIVTAVDKANVDVAVMSRTFNALTLMKELGLRGNNANTP